MEKLVIENKNKIVVPLFGAAFAAPNQGITILSDLDLYHQCLLLQKIEEFKYFSSLCEPWAFIHGHPCLFRHALAQNAIKFPLSPCEFSVCCICCFIVQAMSMSKHKISYDVVSGSGIKPCNKIFKPLSLQIYRFLGKCYDVHNNVAYTMTKL